MIPENITIQSSARQSLYLASPNFELKSIVSQANNAASEKEPPKEFELEIKKEPTVPSKNERMAYYKTEILAGIIVAFVLVPQECAYAFIAHMDPSLGTHCGWIVGLTTSLLGGRPGMITGFTGGLASLAAGIVSPEKGPNGGPQFIEEFFLSAIVAGIFLGFVGLFKLGKFSVMVPATVKVGFCNGLAIIIAKGQTYAFYDEKKELLQGVQMAIEIIYILLTAFIFDRFPKLKYKWAKVIPSALVCMVVIIILEFGVVRNVGYHTLTLKDIAPFSSDNAYPKPFFINPAYDNYSFDSGSTGRIILNAIMLGLMAVLETTMTQEVVNEYTNNDGNLDRQFMAIGLSNIFCGFFGVSMGSSLLGISTINMVNGGKGRISTFVAAFLVMIIMFGAYPLLNFIPLGVLVGMLFVVVYRTFRWFTITALIAEMLPSKVRAKLKMHSSRIDHIDLLIILIVTVFTVIFNLLIAAGVGTIIACFTYTYKNSHSVEVKSEIITKGNKQIKFYMVEGPVFYASKKKFFKYFQIDSDPQHVHIDFDNDLYMDYTFIEALNKLCKKYKDSGREIKIKKLKRTAQKTVEKFHRFVNNIEFIEEKIDLPGVPQFIMEAHNNDNNAHEIKEENVEEEKEESRVQEVPNFQSLDEQESKKVDIVSIVPSSYAHTENNFIITDNN